MMFDEENRIIEHCIFLHYDDYIISGSRILYGGGAKKKKNYKPGHPKL